MSEALSEASSMARFMGLPKWGEFDDLRLVEKVSQGLPVSTVETILRRIDPEGSYLRIQDIVPKSTYYRRKEVRKPLTREQSERILALSQVFREALRQYHDDHRSAAMFLTRPHPMLHGRPPMDVARESIAGSQLVMKLLVQADAGVAA